MGKPSVAVCSAFGLALAVFSILSPQARADGSWSCVGDGVSTQGNLVMGSDSVPNPSYRFESEEGRRGEWFLTAVSASMGLVQQVVVDRKWVLELPVDQPRFVRVVVNSPLSHRVVTCRRQ